MSENTIHKSISKKLGQLFLEAWQASHGGNPDEIHTLMGDNSIAFIVSKAMVQAEIALYQKTTNRVLDQYLRSVLEMIAEDLIAPIEDYSGRQIQQVIPLIDLKAGWITAFYRFKDQVEYQHDRKISH
jgi:hypothetical protein